jgi:hypothetical protein
VGGERVAQGVRAHAIGEPGGVGVALDDLVQALAGEAGAAVVDEQARLEPFADQLGPAAAEVGVDRARRRAADRHEPFLGALAAGAQDARLEVHVAGLEVDGLAGPQAAGVHELQQGTVAQRRGLRAARLLEQLGHLVAREHVRQAPALLGRAQVRRGIGLDDPLPAQVAMEGAQAGHLALQRGRGHRRLLTVSGGQRGDEAGEVGMRDRERVAPVQVRAVLQEVRAVGLERVAREPALELQVREEVEHEVLERFRCRGRVGASVDDGHREHPSMSA